jgi:hypothetical protein
VRERFHRRNGHSLEIRRQDKDVSATEYQRNIALIAPPMQLHASARQLGEIVCDSPCVVTLANHIEMKVDVSIRQLFHDSGEVTDALLSFIDAANPHEAQ